MADNNSSRTGTTHILYDTSSLLSRRDFLAFGYKSYRPILGEFEGNSLRLIKHI